MSSDAALVLAVGVFLLCCAFGIERCDYVDKRGEWLRQCAEKHDIMECKP